MTFPAKLRLCWHILRGRETYGQYVERGFVAQERLHSLERRLHELAAFVANTERVS